MSGEAFKRKNMNTSYSLSTGVEIGSWSTSTGASLPVVKTNLKKAIEDLESKENGLIDLMERLEKPARDLDPIPLEILNESFD